MCEFRAAENLIFVLVQRRSEREVLCWRDNVFKFALKFECKIVVAD